MTYSGNLIRKAPLAATQDSASGIWTLDQAQAAVRANTWPVANGVSRSLRFNSADSAFLTRTPASASNRRTWTWSGWVKYSVNDNGVFNAPLFWVSDPATGIMFEQSPNTPHRIYVYNAGELINTTQLFRDASSWYHIVTVIDNTQATAADRTKLYINGVQVTAFAAAAYPALNADGGVNAAVEHNIGRQVGLSRYFDGYMAEVNFVDGLALTPSDFALTDPDTNQWRPKRYSGSHGVNGFYLDFSDNTATLNLGLDRSGYTNDWTASGFTVTGDSDSVVDTPTNYNFDFGAGGEVRGNYAVFSSITSARQTVADGGLSVSSPSTWAYSLGTIAVNSGKWYFEASHTDGTWHMTGVDQIRFHSSHISGTSGSKGISLVYDPSDTRGDISYNGGNSVYTGQGQLPYTAGQIIGVALDLDNNNVKFYKNNSLLYDLIGLLEPGAYYTFGVSLFSGGSATVNFGQQPFAYTAPSGFKSLCSTNLPEPAIRNGGEYFNTVLYTGTGSTQSITGVGFQPDWVWVKSRSVGTYHHRITDAVRGVTKEIYSNLTNAEGTDPNGLTAFGSDGFTLGSSNEYNFSGATFVAWCWRAGGAGVANTQGTITSQVSANTDSGFSIVTYTGNNTVAQSVGHGLGAAPAMIIVKSRSNVTNWLVWHKDYSVNSLLLLNDTSGVITPGTGLWGSATPTSTTFGLNRADSDNNRSGESHVAYCWAEVAGFSKFGSYTANGSVDGPFIYCGFKPRFIMIKATSATSQWVMIDTARDTFNSTASRSIFANNSGAEETGNTAEAFDIVSNGFKLRSNGRVNVNTVTHIFMAFAEAPFGNINGTAR